ncbi:MAG: NAD(+) synthase [bacterium]|nr:NAD(+) synthase [bacterium]
MANHGFVRVAACVPRLRIGDPMYNVEQMLEYGSALDHGAVQLAVFPELGLTGYTCRDLFEQDLLLTEAEGALGRLVASMPHGFAYVVGMPLEVDGMLFNCAVVCANGKPVAVIPKRFIPNEREFEERRWFRDAPALRVNMVELCGRYTVPIGTDILIQLAPRDGTPSVLVGVEVCEDLWVSSPPSTQHALAGALIIANISASPVTVGKAEYRRQLVESQSARCVAGYVYASAGVDESSADVTFDGHSLIAESGRVLAETERFRRSAQMIVRDLDVESLRRDRRVTSSFGQAAGLARTSYRTVTVEVTGIRIENGFERTVDRLPFVPKEGPQRDARCAEVFQIQRTGLARRLEHLGTEHGGPIDVHLALSGGLDSTHAALVAIGALEDLGWPREHLKLFTMPGFGTTDRTRNNAHLLAEALDLPLPEQSIVAATEAMLRASGHEPCHDCLMCENAQARVRQQIMLNRGFTLGTGDLSEKALGWCTFAGDHIANYDVNCGVPKTLIRYLIAWVAETRAVGGNRAGQLATVLRDIVATPISPELRKAAADGTIAQKTEDLIGPYDLHDFFLFHMIRHGARPEKVAFLAEHAFAGVYGRAVILHWLRVFYERFFKAQFKRNATPDGPKVGSVALSPRGDWRMPSDVTGRVWIEAVMKLAASVS